MIIEHRTFLLAAGVSEADFLLADKAVQEEFAPFQPGFVRRTTARDGATWLVETFWYERANAEAAAGADAAAVTAFDGCVDRSTERIARYETLD